MWGRANNCSTAREMTGQCENNTSNQMLPETNIDKSPYTYVKKLQKELYFIDLFLEKRLILIFKNTFNFYHEKLSVFMGKRESSENSIRSYQEPKDY